MSENLVDYRKHKDNQSISMMIRRFGSLGAGGVFGGSVAALIYLWKPSIVPTNLSYQFLIGIGSSVGIAGFRILRPVGNFLCYYFKLGQLLLLRKLLGKELQQDLIKRLSKNYFVDGV